MFPPFLLMQVRLLPLMLLLHWCMMHVLASLAYTAAAASLQADCLHARFVDEQQRCKQRQRQRHRPHQKINATIALTIGLCIYMAQEQLHCIDKMLRYRFIALMLSTDRNKRPMSAKLQLHKSKTRPSSGIRRRHQMTSTVLPHAGFLKIQEESWCV